VWERWVAGWETNRVSTLQSREWESRPISVRKVASWDVNGRLTIWFCDSTNMMLPYIFLVSYNKVWAFFFIIKPTRCTNFTNLFWHETLHVSESSSVHHQEFIHCTLSNGTCRWLSSSTRMVLLESHLQTCMTCAIAECTVNKLLMMDRRTVRNM